MNYIEKIKRNVTDAINVKKIALAQKVDYLVAKIMYHNGKNDVALEDAIAFAKIINESKIQLRLIDDLDLITTYQSHRNTFNKENIFKEIAGYVNRKYINELSNYIYGDVCYGLEIDKLMKTGLSLDNAIKVFELKIKYEMKINGLSEFAALSKLLLFRTNEKAMLFLFS